MRAFIRRRRKASRTPSLSASALAAALVLAPAAALAAGPVADGDEPEPEQARPTIGLVLSGGGARGLAHLGVIEWLEQQRIPVDMVAGTSIGGLVGALYATGADSAEMRAFLDAIDWQLVLSADTPYPQKALRRKQDAREAPATFELGLRDGFKLPPGFDDGHQVGLVLDRIGFPYAGVTSFDELPTPFACVAVDLETGRQVVFRNGSLSEAMRATMSYPGWFSPLRSGDRVLVDGGVLNNLPTDVMLEMGADIVIAVDLGMVAAEEEPFDNVLGVLNRTLSVMMRDNTDRNAAYADVLVTPDVSAYGFADFDQAEELARIGYRAAESVRDALSGFGVDEGTWQAYVGARTSRRREFSATPLFIEVEGEVSADESSIEAALDQHIGVPLDPDRLDEDLTDITGWGRYSVAAYENRIRGDRSGLGIEVHSKTYGPPFVRPILDLRGAEFGEALITFGARFTFFDLAGTNSELRVDATYGQRTEAATELFMPLGHRGFFAAPRAIAGREIQRVYADGEALSEYEVRRLGVGADVGYLFGPRSELRAGFAVEHQRARIEVGEPLFESLGGTMGSIHAGWLFDGADSPIIPTRGVRFNSIARWIFQVPTALADGRQAVAGDDQFYQAELGFTVARPLGGRFHALVTASGGTSFDATASPLQQFLLGGPLRLGALGEGERRGSNYYLGRAGVFWALADENTLSFFGKFYLAALYEVGDAFERSSDPFQDVTFGVAGETLLGGLFVGGAIGQDKSAGFFFAVGRLF